MTQQMSREASRKFGLAILAELGVDPDHVLAGSLQLERIGEEALVSVTWDGFAAMDFQRVADLMAAAQEEAPK
jgi:hypothetical protein